MINGTIRSHRTSGAPMLALTRCPACKEDRLGRKFAVAAVAALLAVGLTPGPARATTQAGVAVAGSALAGYGTPAIVVAKAAPFNFVNADPLAPHDIVSTEPGPVRDKYLFASQVIGVGASEVAGIENTETGQTYEFFCTVHPATMRGTLVVI